MRNAISMLQDNARNLCQDLERGIEKYWHATCTLRTRIIAFRDYLADGADAMLSTDFFSLPDEAESLKKAVDCLAARGGGEQCSGLEALAYAIRSQWTAEGMRFAHVIVLLTDKEAHDLGYGRRSEYYPNGMARNFQELTAWWGSDSAPGFMDQYRKRLLLFAPETGNWKNLFDEWDNTLHLPVEWAMNYERLLSVIVHSL